MILLKKIKMIKTEIIVYKQLITYNNKIYIIWAYLVFSYG